MMEELRELFFTAEMLEDLVTFTNVKIQENFQASTLREAEGAKWPLKVYLCRKKYFFFILNLAFLFFAFSF